MSNFLWDILIIFMTGVISFLVITLIYFYEKSKIK